MFLDVLGLKETISARKASVTGLSYGNRKNKVHMLSSCLFCLNILQVEVVVNVRGSTELHRGDMELLPVRDLGVETTSISPLVSEITAVLGPLCFL